MKNFESYYNNSAIIKMLCKHRAKISHNRHKKHMVRDISLHNRTNKIKISDNDSEFVLIQSLFPTRRNWNKLNQNERLDPKKLNNSLEKNEMRLWKSYKYEKYLVDFKNKTPEKWYLNLIDYCEGIREKVIDLSLNNSEFSDPEIFPLLKSSKDKKYIYRPIAKYKLDDKIITSLLSRYLTINFDRLFSECSFAFRARNSKGKIPNHHDSIIEILKYQKKHNKIWVSECDIQKFFDTVQHEHLIKVFREAIKELKNISISPKAIKLFELFLKSYSFNKNVYSNNNNSQYFKEKGVKPGKFGWVEDELISVFDKDYISDYKIGVPQGNAISCFIANLILNKIDNAVKEVDKDIFYIRYCDDMVLAHPNKEICEKALIIYKEGIRNNFLLYHKPKEFKNYKKSAKEFWKLKSKEPYFLGNKYANEDNVPWLSFVGYQINYKGEIRVRKSSIQKEIKKQISETQRILISLGLDRDRNLKDINKYSRKTKRQIIFSLQQRLISMSVGRKTIYNFNDKDINNGLCWTNGFKILNKNPITIKQLKELDRGREQQISYLKKMIKELDKEKDDFDEIPKYMKNLYFGLPYSYYNHLN